MSLPTFEGPLDLLLHLCQKHELDILDIPIAFVTEKYLEYLAVLTLLNLDVASEYLVMAATLAHIKSKMLSPGAAARVRKRSRGVEDDPQRDADPAPARIPRKYQNGRRARRARRRGPRRVFLRGASIESAVETGLPPLAQVALFSLVEAFQGVLEKSKVKLTHDIVHERVSLADRINELVDILRERRRITFEELFDGDRRRGSISYHQSFLAALGDDAAQDDTPLPKEDFNSPIYVEFSAQVTGDEDPDDSEDGDDGDDR